MSEFTAGGSHGFGFENLVPADVNIELSIYMDELSAARQRSLDQTPGFRDKVGLPKLTDNPALVAEFATAVYGIDRYDSSLIDTTQLANLVAINEHATAMLVPAESGYDSPYRRMLTSTAWIDEPIENNGQKLEYVYGAREIVQHMSPQKVQAINVMRFAARVWIDRFEAHQRSAAAFGASVIFGNLFEETMVSVEDKVSRRTNPEEAYVYKQEAYEAISNYCFAGLPMSKEQAREYAVMSRRAF